MATIRLAFSPDSDDIFMFWPLLHHKVSWGEHTFVHVRADTQTLNQRAHQGVDDVVAISVAAYPLVQDRYLLLPHGGSVGRGYGPVLIASKARSLAEMSGATLGVPGLNTTAYLVLRTLVPHFTPVILPIAPYALAFDAVRSGNVDAALLIHEGRLRYEQEGFVCIVDVGQAWAERTGGLPLPLGGNAIARHLGPEVIADVSDRLRESIRWALQHRDEMMEALLAEEVRADVGITRQLLDRYLAMYANEDTLAYPPDARQACERLITEGKILGLYDENAKIEWAP